MRFSLRTKLSLSYVFVILLLVASISFFSNVLLENRFKDYVIKQQEQRNREVRNLVANQYAGNGKWNGNTIENIGINALEQGMIIKVRDSSGNTVWDATVHNNGFCMQMLAHMSHNMISRYPNFDGGYVENSFPLTYGSEKVGTIEIGYYGPYYYTDNDLAFINTLNRILVVVGLAALAVALALGAYMAERLSSPISNVVKTARQISRGYFGDRVLQKSRTKEIIQLTGTVNDLAETLEKQEALRKRMAADVAHELRTPLATLQSHLEAMIDGVWKPDAERLSSCHEEIVRISRMVGDLEKLTRLEGETITLNRVEFDIGETVRHIVLNYQPDFTNKGVGLTVTDKKETILADRDKISQVIVNLLSNALKYTPAGGTVETGFNSFADRTEVYVRDTGTGISPEDLPFIFERFYRADKSRDRLTGGSGIGLTISRAIAQAHKGEIKVSSEPGKGSEFILVIPKKTE